MKFHVSFLSFALVASVSAAEVPKVFAGLFEQDVPVKGQIGVVLPPQAGGHPIATFDRVRAALTAVVAD